MKILVQKFGGTSVGSEDGIDAISRIVQASLESHRVVVVVSAISSKTKAEGTTSLLLEACSLAASGKEFDSTLEKIRVQHTELIARVIKDSRRQQTELSFVDSRLAWAKSFLQALSVIQDLSPRSHDAIISLGEQLSAHIVAAGLSERGISAEPQELHDIVPAGFEELDHKFFQKLASAMASLCVPKGQHVPVVTGFFGTVPGGLLRRIGRGYSDLTAALIAAGFGNRETEELQIWKEVDGVFSCDPRRVPAAKVLSSISAQEASELTYFGSEVIHPYTMEQVISAGIPIRVKNTHRPEHPGTLIVPTLTRTEKGATAVTAKRGVSVVMVKSNRMYEARGFLAGVFGIMRDLDVSVDLVSTSEVSISFTVDDPGILETARPRLEAYGETSIIRDRAILALVGEGLRGLCGAAGQLFVALGKRGINVEMISQGIAETNISCVLKESDTDEAVRVAHAAFFE